MSTADKLGKVLETKLAIKGAITEKGVAVLDTDTFASYPDKIRAIQSGGGEGGGTKKFVTNTTTNTYTGGEKVLVNLGIRPSELSRGFDLKTNNGVRDYGSAFLDNNDVVSLYPQQLSRKFTFSNNQWSDLDISSWSDINIYNPFYRFYKDGFTTICNASTLSGADSSKYFTGEVITTSTCYKLPSDYAYLGNFNGQDYAYNSKNKAIATYDRYNNTVGETIGATGGYMVGTAFIDDKGKGIFLRVNNSLGFFAIDDDGVYSIDKYVALGTSTNDMLAYFTGASIGDFLFFVTNYDTVYKSNGSSSQKQISTLITYEIVDDGNGGRTIKERPDLFNKFQTDNCLIQYDNRNDVLTIGTMDNVYAYKFNRDTRNFEQLNYTFNLVPNTNQNYCYRLAFSPDMSKAIVTLRSDYVTANVTLYTLGNANWEIVDNQVINYNATTSFSAITTGEVDEDGKVEVKLTLPDEVDLVIDTNVEINDGDIVIEGVE